MKISPITFKGINNIMPRINQNPDEKKDEYVPQNKRGLLTPAQKIDMQTRGFIYAQEARGIKKHKTVDDLINEIKQEKENTPTPNQNPFLEDDKAPF